MNISFKTQKILIGLILIITLSLCILSFVLLFKYNDNVSKAATNAEDNTDFLKNIIKHY